MKNALLILLLIFCVSCGEDYVPKPKAFLRLDYPEAKYFDANLETPFNFRLNTFATKITSKRVGGKTESYGVNIEYPTLRGTIFLSYKSINGDENNLRDFIKDAEKFTLEHQKKADGIDAYPYENKKQRVYGLFAEVKGNAASPSQFYVTDSVNHFLRGSLYFYAKPNYDSILPAADYLQKDIKHIMETIKWK